MRLSRRRKIEWMVVAVIILSCGRILWWPMLSSDVKPWEQGEDVPETPPAEDRRVYNRNQFSFVAPPRWDWRVIPHEPDPTYAYKGSTDRSRFRPICWYGLDPDCLSETGGERIRSPD
jgi:hypothetical protein